MVVNDLAVAKAVAVVEFPDKAPSKVVITNVPAEPDITLLESVAFAIIVNLPVESSKPIKAFFAEPSLYFMMIPLSKLSSEPEAPISKIGSAILTVVELTVVVVPLTVRSPAIVTSSGKPTVAVPPE